MITPWEIYWVLQLDSLRGCLLAFVIIGATAAIIFAVVGAFERSSSHYKPGLEMSKREAARSIIELRWARRLACVTIPLCFLMALIPSTKTAAAMFVVPAIVNNKAIQHEAGDLYQLAKEALREAIAPNHKDKQ
jgi:hypothetical protein